MKDGEVYEKLLSLIQGRGLVSLWEAADLVHERCMQKILPGNGARVTQLRRIGESEKYPLVGYACLESGQHLYLKNKLLLP